MPHMVILLGLPFCIILIELILWRIFANKMARITFPETTDRSVFHFFTPLRMRMIAIIHTVALILIVSFINLILW